MRLSKKGLILTFGVPLLCIVLFVSRHSNVFGIYGSHLSNFALSLLIVFCVGAVIIILKKSFWLITIFAAVLIFANISVEVLVSYMNTPDLLDAAFGIVGVLIALALLLLLNK